MNISKEQLQELYIEQNLSSKEVAVKLGCARTTLYKYLRQFNLPIRKSGRQQKYFANETFFDKWSHEMAYCVGFIAADGHVWKNRPYITIGIHKQDVEILQYLVTKLSPDTKIREAPKDKVQICIHSKGLHKALLKYNINNDKTFGFKIDYNIPNKYFGDFLRGYFDGDGGIYRGRMRKDGSVRYCGSIVSASKQPLEYFQSRLGFGGLRTMRKKYYTLEFSQIDLVKLQNIMYNNDRFALQRKKIKFDNIQFKNSPSWTEEEILILKSNLHTKKPRYLQKLLPNRTKSAIQTRLKRLKDEIKQNNQNQKYR